MAENWEVINPNPDGFIVEDGSLLIISGNPGSLATEKVENLFRLTEPLPKGDWTMTAKLKINFQTSKEVFFLGLYQDKNNYIVGRTWAPVLFNMPSALQVSSAKRSKGKDKGFEKGVWNDGTNHHNAGLTYAKAMSFIPQPILIRLRKTRRSYFVSLMLESMDKPKWVEVEKLTSLRAKENLVFGIMQTGATKGETMVNVDWVKIETKQ